MLDKKTQKAFYKIIHHLDNEYNTLKIFLKKGIADEKEASDCLARLSYILILRDVRFDHSNFTNEETHLNRIFVHPIPMFQILDRVKSLNISEKSAFLDWYLEELAHFYQNKSLEEYQFIAATLRHQFYSYFDIKEATIEKSFQKVLSEPAAKNAYNIIKEIGAIMLRTKKNGIPFAYQVNNLNNLGASKDLIEEYGAYYRELEISKFAEIVDRDESFKKQPLKEETPIEVPVIHAKTEEEKEYNLEQREIKNELNKYFNPETHENVLETLIEGEILKKVIDLLNGLYPTEIVAQFKKEILENNKRIKEEIIAKLMSEENYKKYMFMQEKVSKTYEGDTEYISYIPLFRKALNEINDLIKNYFSYNDTLLIPDFYDQIELIFVDLAPILDLITIENGRK